MSADVEMSNLHANALANHGYNVARIFLEELYTPVNDHKHSLEEELLTKLQNRNDRLKDLSRLISELTKKKSSGKADFNHQADIEEIISRIRESDRDENGRSVIEDRKYSWNSEDEINTQIQALNDLTKRLGDDANLDLMRIQHVKQDKTQVTETTKKSIEEQIELIKIMQRRAAGS